TILTLFPQVIWNWAKSTFQSVTFMQRMCGANLIRDINLKWVNIKFIQIRFFVLFYFLSALYWSFSTLWQKPTNLTPKSNNNLK
ncbi:MAG TPA: hypothetical protein VHS53_01960, partial [Mucilaginibacter sp.]|nr:hypothetical protein [Mucilaginibacter sp.]